MLSSLIASLCQPYDGMLSRTFEHIASMQHLVGVQKDDFAWLHRDSSGEPRDYSVDLIDCGGGYRAIELWQAREVQEIKAKAVT